MLRAAAVLVGGLAVAAAADVGPLPVVTTSTDLKALVEAVGGDRVRVESLAPPAQDPHAVDPKPGELLRLKAAALLVRVGLDHEPWLPRALEAAGNSRLGPGRAGDLDVSRTIELLQSETPRLREQGAPHVHGYGNPHYWLDPANAHPITAAIVEALARLAPADRRQLEANRRQFLGRLDRRQAAWLDALAPYRGSRVVAVHDSWPYFARRFGLTVVATVEPTPGVPPSPGILASLPRRMRDAGVAILIAEPYSSESVVRHIAARSGVPAVTLAPSVGATPEARDYLSLFESNVGRLAAALRGAR